MQASAKLAGKSGSIDVIRTVVHDLAMGAIRGGQIQPHSLAALTEVSTPAPLRVALAG